MAGNRSTTSAGKPGLPRRRLWGWRCTSAWWTAATIASSASIASACVIYGSCRSLISAVMSPSPKLRCARRTSIKRPPVRMTYTITIYRPDRLLLVFASHQEECAILLLRSVALFDSFVVKEVYTCALVQISYLLNPQLSRP